MPVAPGLPPADGASSFTSSDGKAMASDIKVHYEDWSEPWTTPTSDASFQQQSTQTSSTIAGQVSNAVFSIENTSSRPLPAFSHHQEVCSVAPSVAVEAGTSIPGLHQPPLGSISGGMPAFDPTKPPPALFGERNEMQKSDMTSIAKDDMPDNWSNKLKQDQVKNENASENEDNFPCETSRNDEKWNQAGCTPTNLDAARRSDMRAFPPFSDRGSSYEAKPVYSSTSVASIQVSRPEPVAQSKVRQIFSPSNDLKQLPALASCRSFGNGTVPQDEMRWMSQNNPPNLNLPNSALSSFAHVLSSSSAVSLDKAAPQFSHQGMRIHDLCLHPVCCYLYEYSDITKSNCLKNVLTLLFLIIFKKTLCRC